MGRFQKLVKAYIIDLSSAKLREGTPANQKPPISVVMHVQFIAGAVLSLLAWWLENDMPLSPYQMAQYLLSSHGMLQSQCSHLIHDNCCSQLLMSFYRIAGRKYLLHGGKSLDNTPAG